MKVRFKSNGALAYSSSFNTHALAEVMVNFEDGGGDSAFMRDLDVLLPTGWKDMNAAFKDRDLITDNYNTCFFPPRNEEDKERGFTL